MAAFTNYVLGNTGGGQTMVTVQTVSSSTLLALNGIVLSQPKLFTKGRMNPLFQPHDFCQP